MSGSTTRKRVRKSKALAESIWRPRLSRGVSERETVWALRRHHMMTVTVSRSSEDTAEVRALVTGGNAPVDGRVMRWTVLASAAPVDAPKIAAAVDVAKAWAEKQADELAGAR